MGLRLHSVNPPGVVAEFQWTHWGMLGDLMELIGAEELDEFRIENDGVIRPQTLEHWRRTLQPWLAQLRIAEFDAPFGQHMFCLEDESMVKIRQRITHPDHVWKYAGIGSEAAANFQLTEIVKRHLTNEERKLVSSFVNMCNSPNGVRRA